MKSTQFRNLVFAVSIFSVFACIRTPDEGVSLELAKERKKYYHNIEYALHFDIPTNRDKGITGSIEVSFDLYKKRRVILDFRESGDKIIQISIKGKGVSYMFRNGHIIIPSKYFTGGNNRIHVEFIAGETSLNRKEEFLYTLFVPDRASTAFPCFDQPNLKAKFNLQLDIPKSWVAVSNGVEKVFGENDSTKLYQFSETKPISTYLFAFVAGKFDSISRFDGRRRIHMYHRENDSEKVARNIDDAFRIHYQSLGWLKDYTEIAYPFEKLDFILIPDFQYSGMEHPGAIYYRDSRILLDENPSINQKLRRADLIAHEVTHQWFGDLVTMDWFSDVWMKEVFAGFMATKMVNPQFPEVNHDLNFLLSHYPGAYSVDRTLGANPIRQPLDNMLNAGTLYGNIIYDKAPVMMMQLEKQMEQEWFRRGVLDYLKVFSFGNAGWEELVTCLKPYARFNINTWSHAWVYQNTMPKVSSEVTLDTSGYISNYKMIQSRPENALPMMMRYEILYEDENSKRKIAIDQVKDTILSYGVIGEKMASFIVPNSDGKGYGYFTPDSLSRKALMDTLIFIKDPVARASWYISRHEMFLNKKISLDLYFNSLVKSIQREREPMIRQYLLDALRVMWWKFTSEGYKISHIERLERLLFGQMTSTEIKDSERKPIFSAYINMLNTKDGVETLFRIWNKNQTIAGLKLDEQDYITLSFELAVRDYAIADSILNIQEQNIKNQDRLAKFKFIRRAVSTNMVDRDSFFDGLSELSNRRPEPWVIEALGYLHHPLRTQTSIKYLKPSLDMIELIQKTGDIFFPKSWLDATLSGHNSKEAAKMVIEWLVNNPKVSKNLKDKVYQSADMLFRAAGER